VSRKRSNQLSYEPETINIAQPYFVTRQQKPVTVIRAADFRNTSYLVTVELPGEQVTMSKQKHPAEQSQAHAQKNVNMNTRGKNASGQTNGQNEQDRKRRSGQYTQAGEAPIMKK
jgi:hypothetical protein